MSHNTDISKLDDLIVTTIDSIKGYEHSADKAHGAYAGMFRRLADERREVVAMLQAHSRELGGSPSDFGSAAATLHRRWEDLRTALGGGDEAVLKEIERGEDYLKEEYQRALGMDSITPSTREVISRAYESVRKGHDRTHELRDGAIAAA